MRPKHPEYVNIHRYGKIVRRIPVISGEAMKQAGLVTLVATIYLLHQDFWLWGAQTPRLFGFLPPGLWYHGIYTLATAALMALLVRVAWPADLERGAEEAAREEERG